MNRGVKESIIYHHFVLVQYLIFLSKGCSLSVEISKYMLQAYLKNMKSLFMIEIKMYKPCLKKVFFCHGFGPPLKIRVFDVPTARTTCPVLVPFFTVCSTISRPLNSYILLNINNLNK